KKPQPATARLGTQGTQAGDAVGDGWIEFRAKTMRYFLFDKSCRRFGPRSDDLLIFIGQAPKQAQKRYAKSALC
ncbi:hypothetical protein, partial [Pseudomonas sp. Irchel 3E19]|uniref:hypothetical protein n=1 Tax=Pseudomonas sp. Irchel 3E19 TaxID=2008981 RepID=UPI001C446621